MKVATLLLAGEIWWNLGPADPPVWPIASLGGCQIVNPLVFAGAVDGPQILPFAADCCYVLTSHLAVQIPDSDSLQADRFGGSCVAFLRTLRLVAKQASLPTDLFGIHISELDSLPELKFPGAPNTKGFLIGKYRFDTAVTTARIGQADQYGLTPDIPICHEILLDALRACEKHNAREAILYAAIAVEAFARTVLETEYRRTLTADPPPAHANVLSFPQAGGGIVRKDPIYALLADGDSFSRLLHEVPLYLLRRSLLQDNENLYRRAINLYRTRNRLSHGRLVEAGEEDLFFIDGDGALRSLAVAIEVFQWFGASGYLLPRLDQVPFGG